MHHLHNLQQVLLAQLRQRLRQLLHIDIAVLALAHFLLLGLPGRRRARNPIALRRSSSSIANIPTLPQRIQQRTLGVAERNIVRALVALLLEIEVVRERVLAVLAEADGREDDLHVELAPAFLVDAEGRAAELLAHALGAEAVVEDVGCFLVAGGRQLVAVGAHEEDLDVPAAHGDAFHFGGVIAGRDGVSDVHVEQDWGGCGLVLVYVMCCSVTSLTVLLTCDYMSVSGRFLLAVCTHPRGGTGHVHPAWWCLVDAPAGARRKGFWWVGGIPKVVCMISMESQRSVLSRGW
jgi:hypothetical protein